MQLFAFSGYNALGLSILDFDWKFIHCHVIYHQVGINKETCDSPVQGGWGGKWLPQKFVTFVRLAKNLDVNNINFIHKVRCALIHSNW